MGQTWSYFLRSLHYHRRYAIRTKSREHEKCLRHPTEKTNQKREDRGRSSRTPQGSKQINTEWGTFYRATDLVSVRSRQHGIKSKKGSTFRIEKYIR